jgi:hypothetical protein
MGKKSKFKQCYFGAFKCNHNRNINGKKSKNFKSVTKRWQERVSM